MNIGEPQKEYEIRPAVEPVPTKDPEMPVKDEPAQLPSLPVRKEPEKVPAKT